MLAAAACIIGLFLGWYGVVQRIVCRKPDA
jgi:hypothetical protein